MEKLSKKQYGGITSIFTYLNPTLSPIHNIDTHVTKIILARKYKIAPTRTTLNKINTRKIPTTTIVYSNLLLVLFSRPLL